ncbi:MAG TPA: ankyrin repeat domain-containing protein [Candidatus Latescibacteria bacterium]|nr:ankyrin repeat domain-containing protein [Candidatus Latescibacterota bacterium]HJP32035.1 ankyrin repeat domain-containing protein [Candidatus Latescibacterota bacterium]
MSTPTRSLPASPNLEHLRKQAKDLQRDHQNGRAEALGRIRDFLPKLSSAGLAEVASAVVSRTDAQLVIAREYGFASWPLLAQAVEAPPPPTQSLKSVIEQGDVTAITEMLQQNPHLRDQEFGWTDHKGRQRRITPIRFAHARDQLASFSALRDAGADMRQFNLALWNNAYNLNLPQVKRLLTLGVDPNRGMAVSQTRLGPRRYDVVNALIDAGAEFEDGPRMDIHRGRLDALERRLQKDPSLGHQLFEDSLAGQEPMVHLSGEIGPLRGTLLHIAAAHNDLASLELLLRHGANIDRPAPDREDGSGGQTPIYFTIGRAMAWSPGAPADTPAYETCWDSFEFLSEKGADLSVQARCLINGTIRKVTPLGYALARRESLRSRAPRPQVREMDREIDRLQELGASDSAAG